MFCPTRLLTRLMGGPPTAVWTGAFYEDSDGAAASFAQDEVVLPVLKNGAGGHSAGAG